MAKLSGTTVMLTGAGGALATALAQELIDAGAELILVGRGEAFAKASDRFPAKDVLEVDLADPSSIDKLKKHKADVLIHTAGAYSSQDAQKATEQDYDDLFGSNMRTLFHAVQGVLPHMIKQKEGLIVGVASLQAAHMKGPKEALYTASKAAVSAYLLSLDEELKSKGINTLTLYPMGYLDTPANREAGLEWQDTIDLRALAQALAHAITRPPRAHITELKIYPDH